MAQPSKEAGTQPALPPNISIYHGPGRAALLSATLFTRLATTASDPKTLSAALSSSSQPSSSTSPCWHQHQNAVLIFDGPTTSTSTVGTRETAAEEEEEEEEEEKKLVQDRHHEHFREVCLLLKDANIGVQYGRCVFDAGSALAAGFQLDKLGSGDVMVVDLQQMEDDAEGSDDNDDDDDDDGDSDSDIDLATLGDVASGSLS